MTPALLGKKIGMTRVYDEKGTIVPVTVVECQPNAVTQVKTADTDGYFAVQVGFEDCKPKHSNYPLMGHAAKAGVGPKRHFAEIRLKEATDKQLGDALTVGTFDGVQYVDVIASARARVSRASSSGTTSAGQPASHGTERKHRSPGSIASRSTNRGHSVSPSAACGWPGTWGRTGSPPATTRSSGSTPRRTCC
jgi:large subunit ribosomal protein L3